MADPEKKKKKISLLKTFLREGIVPIWQTLKKKREKENNQTLRMMRGEKEKK